MGLEQNQPRAENKLQSKKHKKDVFIDAVLSGTLFQRLELLIEILGSTVVFRRLYPFKGISVPSMLPSFKFHYCDFFSHIESFIWLYTIHGRRAHSSFVYSLYLYSLSIRDAR